MTSAKTFPGHSRFAQMQSSNAYARLPCFQATHDDRFRVPIIVEHLDDFVSRLRRTSYQQAAAGLRISQQVEVCITDTGRQVNIVAIARPVAP